MGLAGKGEPLRIPASDWNEMQRMLQWWRGSQIQRAAKELQTAYPPSVIYVRNATSTAKSAFDVLELSDMAVDVRLYPQEKFNSLHLEGIAPTTGYGRWAVLQEACPPEGYARAVVAGVTLAKLSITDAADRACEISTGVTGYLITGYVGTSRILLKNTGVGSDKWGVIRVGDALDNFFGKPHATITAGSSGTVDVWSPDFSGSALGPQITSCYNHSATSLTTSDKVSGCIVEGVRVVSKIC